MSTVLVIEPDRSQAEKLRRVLHGRVRADLAMVESTSAAIDAIDSGVPDLILLSALLSPRDEDKLMTHLRGIGNASHLQTLTIPQLAAADSDDEDEQSSGFGRFKKKKKKAANGNGGADPVVFAQEITGHLARAHEVKEHAATLAPRPYVDQ